jgi:hypothetical protein
MRKNTERGDCKEQQLCMEFIDSKESFASRYSKEAKGACAWGRPACHPHYKHISTTPHYTHQNPCLYTEHNAKID